MSLNTYSSTVSVNAASFCDDYAREVEIFETNPLENLQFVEDGKARFIAVQNGNTLEIQGAMIYSNSSAELILAGVNPRLVNEKIEISSIPSYGTRTSYKVEAPRSLFDWYSSDASGKQISDLYSLDLDNISWTEDNPGQFSGKTYSITLSWKDLTAVYYVKFSSDYAGHIQDNR